VGLYVTNSPVDILKAAASEFLSLQGDAIVTSELTRTVWDLKYDSGTGFFDVTQVGTLPNDPEDAVFVTAATVAPVIAGTVSGQTTTSETPVRPFAHATIGDANVGATDTLTITLGGAGGALTDGTGFSNLTTVGAGVYRLSGTAAAITSELDALVFTPKAGAPNTSSTTFTLSDQSSAGGAPVLDSTTSVIDSDPAPVALIRRPFKSMLPQTSSKQQRRGRDVVFAKRRQRFSCGKAGGYRQNLWRHLLRHVRVPFL
jgi:hypothetical protein